MWFDWKDGRMQNGNLTATGGRLLTYLNTALTQWLVVRYLPNISYSTNVEVVKMLVLYTLRMAEGVFGASTRRCWPPSCRQSSSSYTNCSYTPTRTARNDVDASEIVTMGTGAKFRGA